ncbi:MAG: hypothetical protein ACE5JR_12755 [Gemmatimonadota bacterium]
MILDMIDRRNGAVAGSAPRTDLRSARPGPKDELAKLEAEYRRARRAVREWERTAWASNAMLQLSEARRRLHERDELLSRIRAIRIRLANLDRNDIWRAIDGRAPLVALTARSPALPT